jgi:hypothetical protein
MSEEAFRDVYTWFFLNLCEKPSWQSLDDVWSPLAVPKPACPASIFQGVAKSQVSTIDRKYHVEGGFLASMFT